MTIVTRAYRDRTEVSTVDRKDPIDGTALRDGSHHAVNESEPK
jgi:hypothetical protein